MPSGKCLICSMCIFQHENDHKHNAKYSESMFLTWISQLHMFCQIFCITIYLYLSWNDEGIYFFCLWNSLLVSCPPTFEPEAVMATQLIQYFSVKSTELKLSLHFNNILITDFKINCGGMWKIWFVV